MQYRHLSKHNLRCAFGVIVVSCCVYSQVVSPEQHSAMLDLQWLMTHLFMPMNERQRETLGLAWHLGQDFRCVAEGVMLLLSFRMASTLLQHKHPKVQCSYPNKYVLMFDLVSYQSQVHYT